MAGLMYSVDGNLRALDLLSSLYHVKETSTLNTSIMSLYLLVDVLLLCELVFCITSLKPGRWVDTIEKE